MTVQPQSILSPSALNRFLGCEHRTYLDILYQRKELDAEPREPKMQLLMERGDRHEEGVVADLESGGRTVVSLDMPNATKEHRAAATLEAMRAGHHVLHQGCLLGDGWVGYPDFLIRVEVESDLGAWSYEAHDAKLGSTPRPAHIFQLLFYTDALATLQGRRPARMHLMLGDGSHPSYDPDDFTAYASRVREQFAARYAELAGLEPAPAYPYPVGACEFCCWWHVCTERRRTDDHLSLVAGLQKRQGLRLEAADVASVPALSQLSEDVVVPRLAKATVGTLRSQADLQLRSRDLARPLYELLEPGHDRGLARLPEPSPGDVHFDFEGDQYWGDEGLQYLFGSVFQEPDGTWTYWPLWAHSRAEEKAAFEQWIDWLLLRLDEHPDLHVFHYNSYEVVALKELMTRHSTRELEMEDLLRRRIFVDLYGITRQAVRAGVESYGLKGMEPVYGFERNAALKGAVGSMKRWQAFQETGEQSHLDEIALYNADDCNSTRALYDWLLARRPDAEAQYGVVLDALEPEPPKELTDKQRARQSRVEALRERLLDGLPDDESLDSAEQRALRTTFNLLGYHRREANPAWWEFFNRRDNMSLDQLRDEDSEAIGHLELLETVELPQSWQWTMLFPEQDFKLGPGGVDDPLAGSGATIVELDERTRKVVVKRGKKAGDVAPQALAPAGPLQTDPQIDSLFRFADEVADNGLGQTTAGVDLLLSRAPRFLAGTPTLSGRDVDLDRLKRQVRGLDDSVLAIQGPPGTGKTYTGARLALDLMAAGKTVGVTATSHKAINNLLSAIDEAADEAGTAFRGWKKSSGGDNDYESTRIVCSGSCPGDDEGPVRLRAGTAWYWASEAVAENPVDVLFVDEAGQVALADAIAISSGARSVVLLGDPQQLPQVSQGSHPLGCGASVLEHMLGDADVVPEDRGVLLNRTWRMHPEVAGFISDTMYAGLLDVVDGTGGQRIDSPGLAGSGLRLIGVEHVDNRGRSVEEAEVIAAEVTRLLDGGTYVDRDGDEHPLTIDDILIVAPYNAQVRCLRAELAHLPGARVGTVDKFQGQEAPVVFFSMASSTSDDVSRGMSFLFSRNRLNVAVSRAQALAIVVCSPKLLGATCNTVDDMRLVNMLCRFATVAELGVSSHQ